MSGNITIFNFGELSALVHLSFFDIVNFFRSNYSIISLIVNLSIFLYIQKFFKFKTFAIFFLPLIIFIPQIFGLISYHFNEGKYLYDNINNQSLTSGIFVISACINIANIFILKNNKQFFLIFLVPLIALLLQFILFFSTYSFMDFRYGGYLVKLNFFGKNYELIFNSNGLGRTAAILYTFAIFYFFDSKNIYQKYFFYITSILLIFIVISLSGRYNSLALIFLNILVIIFYKNKIITEWKYIVFAIILITFSSNAYKEYQKYLILQNSTKDDASYRAYIVNNNLLKLSPPGVFDTEVELTLTSPPKKLQENNIFVKPVEKISNTSLFFKLNNYSTGRLAKWAYILVYNEKQILGYGPNMDRNFFKDTIDKNRKEVKDPPARKNSLRGASDAASGIFYQYIASGIVGLIGLFLFFILISIKIISNTKLQNKFTIEKIYTALFIFLSFRVIFENGFLIFGVDFLIFLIATLSILLKNNENILKRFNN